MGKTIDWPEGAKITSQTLEFVQPGQVSHLSPYTAESQVLNRGPGLWAGTVSIQDKSYSDRRGARLVEAFLASLNGQSNVFRMPLHRDTFAIEGAAPSDPVSIKTVDGDWRDPPAGLLQAEWPLVSSRLLTDKPDDVTDVLPINLIHSFQAREHATRRNVYVGIVVQEEFADAVEELRLAITGLRPIPSSEWTRLGRNVGGNDVYHSPLIPNIAQGAAVRVQRLCSERLLTSSDPVTWKVGAASDPVEWGIGQVNHNLLVESRAPEPGTGDILYTLNAPLRADVGMFAEVGGNALMVQELLDDGRIVKFMPQLRVALRSRVLPAHYMIVRLADGSPVEMPATPNFWGPWTLNVVQVIR